MKTKSEQKVAIIIDCVNSFFDKEKRTPSLREIEKETGVSRQTVQRYLKDLNESNEIKYDGKRIVTHHIEILIATRVIRLPIVGHIPCGNPDSQEERNEGYIDFPISLIGNGEYFVLHAYGDSMINAGINDGDLVIIRSQKEAEIGQIVVAIDNDNRNTLKRLSHDGSRYYLHAENDKFPDIYPDELVIQGIATKVIKELI